MGGDGPNRVKPLKVAITARNGNGPEQPMDGR